MRILVQFQRSFLYDSQDLDVFNIDNIKYKLSLDVQIPSEYIECYEQNKVLSDDHMFFEDSTRILILHGALKGGLTGGKGGFGALLRIQARQSGKKATTDFGSCRDLSGRRLRHVNDEKILEKWKEAEENGVKFDPEQRTSSNIDLWFLNTPSWASKVKKAKSQKNRKTEICSDWKESRESRNAPKNAPPWWGCPRGRRCQFAHGDEELRGVAIEEIKKSKHLAKLNEEQKKKEDYMGILMQGGAYVDDNEVNDLVLEGLRAAKKARMGDSTTVIETSNSKETEIHKWLVTFAGDVHNSFDGEIEGKDEFSTVHVPSCRITHSNQYYYEVELITDGLMQIGWINELFTIDISEGDGVGDNVNSWSFDGARRKKWHIEDSDYGIDVLSSGWKEGDIIGCFLAIHANEDPSLKTVEISYSVNGHNMGVAYTEVVPISMIFFPALSLEADEIVIVNIGQNPFRFHNSSSIAPVLTSISDTVMVEMIKSEASIANHYDADLTWTKTDKTTDNQNIKSVATESEDKVFEPIDLLKYESHEQLQLLGLNHLKHELVRRNLKCGGNLQERAQRLFSIRLLKEDEIDSKLRSKK
jgi:hypothetical protein